MERNNQIIYRAIRHEDVDKLATLYNAIWANVDYDKRKKILFVLNTPNGINVCAEFNGNIVGSKSSVMMNMYHGNTPLRCIQYTDSCVSPEFRRRGIFQRLNEISLEAFSKRGDIIFNVSEQGSKSCHSRLGWNYIDSYMSLFKVVHPIRTLFKVRFNIKRLSNKRVWDRELGHCEPIPAQLLANRDAAIEEHLYIRYDLDTLNWRLGSGSGIQVFNDSLGSIIFKLGHIEGTSLRIAIIGEIFLYEYSDKSFSQILKHFIRAYKIDVVQTYNTLGHPLLERYKSAGFISNPRHKYLNLGYKCIDTKLAPICSDQHKWALCAMDLDTF